MKLKDIKPNPDNPRVLRDDKFKKLKQSITEFPKMLSLRPLVIDENNVVLGGNMRLKALQELGFTEVDEAWVKRSSDLTEDEKKRFIIADNVAFGQWDWDTLANDWDVVDLEAWGLEIPGWATGHNINETLSEDDLDMTEEFDPIGVSSGLTRVVFIFDGKEEAESYLKSLNLDVDVKKQGQAWQVNLSTQSI